MKTSLSILATTTALTLAIGAPAWSAVQSSSDDGLRPIAVQRDAGAAGQPLYLAENDDDDDHRATQRRYNDDDGEGHADDDCDSDNGGDDGCANDPANPAPAGTVTPPNNGLFKDGAAPEVKTN